MLSNEVCNNYSNGLLQGDGFYPFSKILGGSEDPYVAIGGWVYGSYKIKPSNVKRPWCGHTSQHIWMSVNCISEYLACMTRFDQLLGIPFHCRLIVTQLQQLPVEPPLPWVASTVTGVDFSCCFSGFPRP